MNFESPLLWLIIGILALIALGFAISRFSPEAKLERRRRKSNSRIVSKANRPTVKFSVRTKKGK